jgi:hypothetical protein
MRRGTSIKALTNIAVLLRVPNYYASILRLGNEVDMNSVTTKLLLHTHSYISF